MDPTTIDAITKGAEQAFANGGWFGLVGFLVPALVELYKRPKTQGLIEKLGLKWLLWAKLKKPVRVGVVGGASFIGALGVTLAIGVGWQAALVAAIPVTIIAIVTHLMGKTAGDALDTWLEARKPQYVPGTIRRAATILLPSRRFPPKKEG